MRKSLALTLALVSTHSFAAKHQIDFYGFAFGNYINAGQMDDVHKPIFATSKTSSDSSSDDYSTFDDAAHRTTSFRRSRIGANYSNGQKVTGAIEFDFDGQTGNSAGTATSDSGYLRWRQANLSYQAFENGLFTFGKKWSAFATVKPHTMQVSNIGLYQGNTGFLIDALQYTHSFGGLGITGELGAKGTEADEGTKDYQNDFRVNMVSNPFMVLKLDYKTENHYFGAAYLYAEKDAKKVGNQSVSVSGTSVNVTLTNDVKIDVYKFFYEGQFSDLTLRAEFSQGKNALGAGYLGELVQSTYLVSAASDGAIIATEKDRLKETTYFASFNYHLKDLNIFGRYGSSEITNIEDMASSVVTVNSTVARNQVYGLGLSYELDTDFLIYSEYTHVKTGRVQTVGSTTLASDSGYFFDIGVKYTL